MSYLTLSEFVSRAWGHRGIVVVCNWTVAAYDLLFSTNNMAWNIGLSSGVPLPVQATSSSVGESRCSGVTVLAGVPGSHDG